MGGGYPAGGVSCGWGCAGDGDERLRTDNQSGRDRPGLAGGGFALLPAQPLRLRDRAKHLDRAGYSVEWNMTATVVMSFTPLVWVQPACDEVGYVTRARISAYQRNRTSVANLVRGEQRCLIADFNGVLSASRSIVSGVW